MTSEPDRPNLTLGQPPGQLSRMGQIPKRWLWLVLLLHIAGLLCLLLLLRRPAVPGSSAAEAPPPGSVEELKAAALELEDRSLDAQAARAWAAYLAAAPQADDRAEIYYRIGKLHMQAELFDEAAAALVRSELAAGGDRELAAKIGPKLVECLRRQGLYGEVGRELARQVEQRPDKPAKARVLATLAGDPLTEADLDRMIQRRVDRMLALQGAAADPASREAVLKQFDNPEARQRLLQELLQTQMFCRRARELKLDREDEYLQARELLVQDLLAGRFLARELEKLQPTDVDLQSYYAANRDRYRQPESIDGAWTALGDDEDEAGVLEGIESAQQFRELLEQRKSADAAAQQTPATGRLVRGRVDPTLGPTDALFELPEGQWTKAAHVHDGQRFLVAVEKKTPPRTPPLSEVRQRVQADYMARKQREWSEKLFRDLMARYDVRLMPANGPGDAKQQDQPPAEKDEK